MKPKGLTLLAGAVIVGGFLILVAVLFSVIIPSLVSVSKTSCANTLRQLHYLGDLHASTHRGEWPSIQEGGLWREITRCDPPLLRIDEQEVLLCPYKGGSVAGDCDYRSPRLPWTSHSPGEIVAADKPGNHGKRGGIVLRKDGSVQDLAAEDPIWKACASRLFP